MSHKRAIDGDLYFRDLVYELLEGAQASARFALDQFLHQEHPDPLCVLHAGHMVELAVKAALADFEPVLLIDRNFDTKTLLYLAGARELCLSELTTLRTVGVSDACSRLAEVRTSFAFNPSVHRAIFEYRNSVAHAGVVSSGQLQYSVTKAVELTESALRAMDSYPERFWGEHEPAVEELIYSSRNKVDARVKAKIDRARATFAEISSELPDGMDILIESRVSREPDVSLLHYERPSCPACGNLGWLIFDLALTELDMSSFPEGDSINEWEIPVFAKEFVCQVCNLRLIHDEPRQDRFQAPPDLRGRRCPTRGHAHRRQPQATSPNSSRWSMPSRSSAGAGAGHAAHPRPWWPTEATTTTSTETCCDSAGFDR